jgi:hypothetical protein
MRIIIFYTFKDQLLLRLIFSLIAEQDASALLKTGSPLDTA